MYKYFPHTEEDIRQMLEKISANSLQDLYAEIPETMRLKKEYNLPSSMSEVEIRSFFQQLGEKNHTLISFAGGGAYDHYAPAVIAPLIARSEYLTAYTPYQPEISQGTLQYIFEYQSMLSELTGMECTNASMYDGTTATAEAMHMAIAASKRRNKILISKTVHPYTVRVVKTYAHYKGIDVEEIEKDQTFCTDKEDLKQKLSTGDVAGVILSYPNFYGILEDLSGFSEEIHAQKALFILNTDPSALAVVKTPAEWGADIACGDGQTLGLPLSFGGPYVGFLSCKKEWVRKLPGRIVGATKDVDGKRAFVLTLQAREQHIRREKANSNICSNQSLMALYVTIYLSLMGKQGLKEVNQQSYANAHYLHDQLMATGYFEPLSPKPFLKEFAMRTTLSIPLIQKKLAEKGFMAGIALTQLCKEGMEDVILFSATEKRTQKEIDQLIALIKEI